MSLEILDNTNILPMETAKVVKMTKTAVEIEALRLTKDGSNYKKRCLEV